jgi:uncharacterized protein (DUF2237 family)
VRRRPAVAGALGAGMAPEVVLEATHEEALTFCDLKDLKVYAAEQER